MPLVQNENNNEYNSHRHKQCKKIMHKKHVLEFDEQQDTSISNATEQHDELNLNTTEQHDELNLTTTEQLPVSDQKLLCNFKNAIKKLNQLPQIPCDHSQENESMLDEQAEVLAIDKNDENDDFISQTFVPVLPTGFSIANLYAHRIREVKPAEYFQHLSTLAKRQIFVKQNLEEGRLTTAEVQELQQSNPHLADRVVRYGEPELYSLMPNSINVAEETDQEARRFTTINPGLNAPVPDHHLCQKWPTEIDDGLQDYIELINKLQYHTSNVDLKSVLTIHAALQYVSKYVSKAEPRSLAFSKILDRAFHSNSPDNPSIIAFQKLLLYTVTEYDYSDQETCHLLFGIPFYKYSQNFVNLNLNKEAPCWLHGSSDDDNKNNKEINYARKTGLSPLQLYWNRLVELRELSLF
ncbi:4893_t:CDS:2 [Cetraspora pellucida]|uniref:4893_t:CDS:1 n=1 Tax=Cetraspora pellucida TaxID=1433469 RepID=A0A9N9NCR9_9GLOM|nr:4893_t:CDS:2 [Cetraspora pellucida]